MNLDYTNTMSSVSGEPPTSATRTQRPAAEINTTAQSANIWLCLFLIYYFSLCDTVLKFLPLQLAIVLRYLPEAILYFLVFILLTKRIRIISFPLFWPLCFCAATMTVSGLLNSSSLLAVAGDFRIYFRFAAFAYILWRTRITSHRIEQLIDGFLGLTVVELVVGGIELIGGSGAQTFFSPAQGWGSGEAIVWHNPIPDAGVWLNGTLGDTNRFGIFMVTSFVLALTIYFMKGSSRYLWIAFGAALGVVLSFSRHSMGAMLPALVLLFIFHRKRISSVFSMRRVVPVVGCACLLAIVGASFSSSLRDRVASAFNREALTGDPTANIRLFMTLELTPRFLNAYPFFGQGPILPADAVPVGETDTSLGPTLKAAPNLPGWVTFYLPDVVWLLVLGLYGCAGLTAFGFLFWSIATAARKVVRDNWNSESTIAAQACLVMIVLFVMSGFFSEEIIARDMIPIFWTVAGMILSLAKDPLPALAGPV